MNLNKKCLSCGQFFPAKLMEFRFFCDKVECQKKINLQLIHIKKSRHIPANYFDIYDLDRPLIYNDGKIVPNMYERVCRVCGDPLLNKKGEYSYRKRYCNEHNGWKLWAKYNWQTFAKDYAEEIRNKNEKIIEKRFKEIIENTLSPISQIYQENPKRFKRDLNNLMICEECGKLCQKYALTYLYNYLHLKVINIHHIIPVHTLNWDNLHLIWDKSNLIVLCEDCHNQQDHHLKQFKEDPFVKFKKITEFLY